MYDLLALLSGVILAVMLQMDGELGAQFGVYHAALYTHCVGAIFAALVLIVLKKRVSLSGKIPVWMYLGGAVGVLTTVFDNIAFTHISLTSIVALGLFAQMVLSCLIDRFVLFGMQRQAGGIGIFGALLSLAGIVLMLGSPKAGDTLYILLSLAAGVTVVLSRVINSHLAQRIGELQGSFINHLVGVPFCLLAVMAIPEAAAQGSYRLWAWCGGALGVLVVLLCNLLVPRLPAYRLTVLTFCGQLFSGVLLDVLLRGTLNKSEFFAGLLVAAGVAVSQISQGRRLSRGTAP